MSCSRSLCPHIGFPMFSRSKLANTRRYAQVVSAHIPQHESQASSSHSQHRPQVRTQTPKGKEKGITDEYRFPLKGRNGGGPDPFEVLGLDRSASEADVKRQYYRLALLLHPDSSHPSSSPSNFATLHRAYTLLSKPSSKSSYLQTGYGWGSSSVTGNGGMDEFMRTEAANRRRGGAAAWETSRRGYRESEAGRGAWGGFRGGDGGWQPYDESHFGFQAHDYSPGKREERYMSNHRFLAVIGCVVAGWVQYHRLGMATGLTREVLDGQHLDASHALAEARQEAALYGKERRERIRRRVREAEVLREVEKLDLEIND